MELIREVAHWYALRIQDSPDTPRRGVGDDVVPMYARRTRASRGTSSQGYPGRRPGMLETKGGPV